MEGEGIQGPAPAAVPPPAAGAPLPPGRPTRRGGPKALGTILPELLKRLGGDAAKVLESAMSGETP